MNYGHGFRVPRCTADVYVIRPSWFARVFLRRKPKVITVYDAAALLAARAWEAERKLVEDVYRDRILK